MKKLKKMKVRKKKWKKKMKTNISTREPPKKRRRGRPPLNNSNKKGKSVAKKKDRDKRVSSCPYPWPKKKLVLYLQRLHISSSILAGEKHVYCRTNSHNKCLKDWKLTKRQKKILDSCGFKYLRKIIGFTMDNSLVNLVDRWRPGTSTFHFPQFEMTITLEDVCWILRLKPWGLPVTGSYDVQVLGALEEYLGVDYESLDVSGMLGITGKGNCVKLTWLRATFSKLPKNLTDVDFSRHTVLYMLYLLGSTIFSESGGGQVNVKYLPLLSNISQCGGYAWGASALAYLYRIMDRYVYYNGMINLSGSGVLLTTWAYERINIARSDMGTIRRGGDDEEDLDAPVWRRFPRAFMWM
ncbi:hypothetical protein GIB67_020358 [Kingdonia uniflora]|uniref:Aminotransferase-like plant mobile domain-containing protein n=1 Tax=Kingdonia uniflora TaxID=39325 RepID=A0A7J7LRC5_9MAGN|nr:hypothetical protein GIB67_020358 [Kingdonia uniflora]